MRRALARRIDAKHPIRDPSGLAEQILGIADTLTQILEHAAALDRPIPPPIGNVVHELPGWAARLHHPGGTRHAVANASHILAYIRGLPDQQLLALLADLPWARLDALLDAIELTEHASSRVGKHP